MEDLNKFSKSELINYISLLEEEISKEKSKLQKEAEEYSALEHEYEKILDEKNKEIVKLKGKVISQEITLASYKDKVGVPIIVEGKEHDLYEGEQKDFIRNILTNTMSGLDKYTRTYKICESLLEANSETGEREKIQKTISSILKNYNGMTKDIISELNSIGIKVINDSGHFKLIMSDDDRYVISISHTPSDSKCGLNAIADINRILF